MQICRHDGTIAFDCAVGYYDDGLQLPHCPFEMIDRLFKISIGVVPFSFCNVNSEEVQNYHKTFLRLRKRMLRCSPTRCGTLRIKSSNNSLVFSTLRHTDPCRTSFL